MAREAKPLSADTEGPALKRTLTTPLLYFFILGDVLGAGVYVLVGQVAADSGGAVWAPLAVALLLALLTASSYAELATKYPRAGGASHYVTRAFGPFAGFVAGFCMLAAGIVSVAALARGFGGDYLSAFVTLPVGLVAVAFLALLALVNARGVKESTRANVVATVIEVGGLLVIVVLGGWLLLRGDGDLGRLGRLGTPEKGAAAALLSGAVLAYYSFVGFETSVNVAEETRDPRRSYPRALFGALATAGAVYVLVGIAASAAVPTARLAGSSGPLLEVVREAGGVPPRLFSAIALVAVANGALLTGIMSSRLAYGMARDGLLPRFLTKVLPGRRTPWAAIAVTTALAMALALTGSVATLASTLVLLLLVVFLLVNIAVLVLRRDPGDAGHFRTPTVLPVLGAVSCVVLATQVEGDVWLRGLLVLATGVVLAALVAVRRSRRPARSPDAAAANGTDEPASRP
ncbi:MULTISPECIES: APC family permease [Streptomyces]|uniref:Amino acid transporter n=2 Tax=Streptomyces TaxID=1883 RepID=A0ABT9L7N7_STRGD|nr:MULTISPECIES: APC family permease [Streptomyces]MDP9679713.1 amino acid transporter [Streptomyces griseoviridis]GGS99246.1 amino acid transporter [Streptomyces griseoviridis]GGU23284.1 amino acid transporter [Streptomyces daghestanicus]GHI29985.1 amino acid transporter [Streptomyces daghestanicus]